MNNTRELCFTTHGDCLPLAALGAMTEVGGAIYVEGPSPDVSDMLIVPMESGWTVFWRVRDDGDEWCGGQFLALWEEVTEWANSPDGDE